MSRGLIWLKFHRRPIPPFAGSSTIPNTDDHDYNFKLKHAENFLKDGDKVKAYVFFRGRQIVFKDQGEILLLRFATDLEEWGKVEQMPKLEGKRMIMILAPKPKK